jgi:molybdate transport repressor ModE-like protein
MRLAIHPLLCLFDDGAKPHALGRTLQLLSAIETQGNLQTASHSLNISYRHAWNMLAEMETLLGAPVVTMMRGRGSELTELGKRLVSADKLIQARIGPLLESMAAEIEAEVRSMLTLESEVLKIYASHGFAIETFHKRLQKQNIPIDLSYRGSLEALNAFRRGNCDIAGLHIPIGALEKPVFAQFESLLTPHHRLITLATRRQGIMVAKGNPKGIWNIHDLTRKDVKFVNRQQGSGTRMILDLLLEQEGKTGRDINGYEEIELTHAAIAAYILCGRADAGLGVETAARQFDLEFIPLLSERYLLVCNESLLKDARFAPVLDLLQSSEFWMEVNKLPGYDAVETGSVMEVYTAYPYAAKPPAQETKTIAAAKRKKS